MADRKDSTPSTSTRSTLGVKPTAKANEPGKNGSVAKAKKGAEGGSVPAANPTTEATEAKKPAGKKKIPPKSPNAKKKSSATLASEAPSKAKAQNVPPQKTAPASSVSDAQSSPKRTVAKVKPGAPKKQPSVAPGNTDAPTADGAISPSKSPKTRGLKGRKMAPNSNVNQSAGNAENTKTQATKDANNGAGSKTATKGQVTQEPTTPGAAKPGTQSASGPPTQLNGQPRKRAAAVARSTVRPVEPTLVAAAAVKPGAQAASGPPPAGKGQRTTALAVRPGAHAASGPLPGNAKGLRARSSPRMLVDPTPAAESTTTQPVEPTAAVKPGAQAASGPPPAGKGRRTTAPAVRPGAQAASGPLPGNAKGLRARSSPRMLVAPTPPDGASHDDDPVRRKIQRSKSRDGITVEPSARNMEPRVVERQRSRLTPERTRSLDEAAAASLPGASSVSAADDEKVLRKKKRRPQTAPSTVQKTPPPVGALEETTEDVEKSMAMVAKSTTDKDRAAGKVDGDPAEDDGHGVHGDHANLIEAVLVDEQNTANHTGPIIVQAAVEVDKEADSNNNRRLLAFVVVVCCCAVVLIVVAIVVAVVILQTNNNNDNAVASTAAPVLTLPPQAQRPNNSNNNNEQPQSQGNSNGNNNRPDGNQDGQSKATCDRAEEIPTNSGERSAEFESEFEDLVDSFIEGSIFEQEESSPYVRALEWILYSDPLQLDPTMEDVSRVQQRYLMALFYFSLSQDGEWLSCNPPDVEQADVNSFCVHQEYKAAEMGAAARYEPKDAHRWLSGVHECCWAGVQCDDDGDEVEMIELGGYNLNGELLPEVGFLSGLKRLYLTDNSLVGSIPSHLGLLNDLEYLSIAMNGLEGWIPSELCDLRNLKILVLNHNALEGTILECFEWMTQLERIALSHNQLTGIVTPKLGRLRDLKELRIEGNRITGPMVDQ
ncbi:leucine Rich Repeat (Partial), partial [Seminavis robusta]|eukprot:Sro3806_g351220.1 leucine Rich Repeat (938) ;mRNA; r:10-3001